VFESQLFTLPSDGLQPMKLNPPRGLIGMHLGDRLVKAYP
jgi:hypothetical protein